MAVQVQQGDQQDSSPRSSPVEFNLFLRNRIHDLQTLRAQMSHANFIAMDTEHGEGLSSVGLAFASNLAPIGTPTHPAIMTGASEQGRPTAQQNQDAPPEPKIAQSICFNRASMGPNVEDVASKVTNAVKGWKEAQPGKPLVLVTYSSREELNAISNLFPQLCQIFSAWVDLQPLVLEAYHTHTNYTRLDGLNISLRYAMKTLGFCTGYQPKDLHHAGNDALRTLAIMACLTHENVQFQRLEELEHVLRVNKYREEQNRLKGTEKSRGLLRKRPGPPSRYPHVAKVTTVLATDSGEGSRAGQSLAGTVEEQQDEEQLHLPPVHICRPNEVWDFFSPYNPDAIGRVCRENCYYVCVPSSEILQHLIEDLEHTSACPESQVVLVEDVSDLRALGAAKREERAKRRGEYE